ncbi:PREDICTED: homeobox-leucine zipper protein HAT3-like [Camelina sativa]|uniref:Homeobox-leucine zipper protein HAT3-like n=1 Tax=Camelina sativa TaxID=90675 RepID=A0ABM1Q823_CAMSA|nr:PREDICTED: homeobox-leucine zipper protein HAT3-like [Camelina sativa]XP_019082909.1 PREDICTED: homeobox-leucine zipper protein HAT3-like [Camelina sativa]XP_019082910.1 PREDICTED: homeobox-leucine zipper protein HAT3-like [Camelina sativa]XP_019082911.1 PREDICTED: homeobox-leucine zipper protein HAT3-like [Camelina sativa]
MGERDDGLGLSLSLSLGYNQKEPSSRSNPMPLASSYSSSPHMHMHMQQQQSNNYSHPQKIQNSWINMFQSSERNSDMRSFLRGIDVNRAPSTVVVDVEDDAAGVSSPNSAVSSVMSGKRSERELIAAAAAAGGGSRVDDNEMERASCSLGGGSDDEDGSGNGDDGSRKKLRLSKEQALVLEETFKEHSTLNPKQKMALAKQLNLRTRQVEVWFQNRRARTKLKQTEVDCEYLKRCCENLTEENRRLQKEVSELRALKLSPHLYMHMKPPTTLTMCPSCERVAVTSSPSSVAPPVMTSSSPMGPMSPWAAIPHRQRPAAGSH